MVTLEESVKELESALNKLKSNSSEDKAHMRFCGATNYACYLTVSEINHSPKDFNKQIALKIRKFLQDGLKILYKGEADSQLVNYAEVRYKRLQQCLRKHKIYGDDS